MPTITKPLMLALISLIVLSVQLAAAAPMQSNNSAAMFNPYAAFGTCPSAATLPAEHGSCEKNQCFATFTSGSTFGNCPEFLKNFCCFTLPTWSPDTPAYHVTKGYDFFTSVDNLGYQFWEGCRGTTWKEEYDNLVAICTCAFSQSWQETRSERIEIPVGSIYESKHAACKTPEEYWEYTNANKTPDLGFWGGPYFG